MLLILIFIFLFYIYIVGYGHVCSNLLYTDDRQKYNVAATTEYNDSKSKEDPIVQG